MATNKRVFTLRLSDEVFDKIGKLATDQHRSMTNYIEFVLLKHIQEIEAETGEIKVNESDSWKALPFACTFTAVANKQRNYPLLSPWRCGEK